MRSWALNPLFGPPRLTLRGSVPFCAYTGAPLARRPPAFASFRSLARGPRCQPPGRVVLANDWWGQSGRTPFFLAVSACRTRRRELRAHLGHRTTTMDRSQGTKTWVRPSFPNRSLYLELSRPRIVWRRRVHTVCRKKENQRRRTRIVAESKHSP